MGKNATKRSSHEKSKSSSPKKAKEDTLKRQKYALVFYLAAKCTGVVFATDIRSKVKLGSQVLVPDPFDWAGPRLTRYQAKLIKYGYEAEWLYNNVHVNKEGVEYTPKPDNHENEERADRKKQELIEAAEKKNELKNLNTRISGRSPLFPVGSNAAPSGSSKSLTEFSSDDSSIEITQSETTPQKSIDSSAQSETTPQKSADNASSERPIKSPVVQPTNSRDVQVTPASSQTPTTQAQPLPRPTPGTSEINENFASFVQLADEAKLSRKRLCVTALPIKFECLTPSANKVMLGETNLYIAKQKMQNMPWVVHQPPDKRKCRVPEDNPTAMYPRAFTNYLLDCLIPKEILRHLRGPTIPLTIFEGIRDYTNGRLERKYKLQDKHFKAIISEYAKSIKIEDD